MTKLNFSVDIKQKHMTEREKSFVYKLVKKGGQFTNQDLAKLWGTKTFPSKFKKILLDEPSILVLLQARPQKYELKTKKEEIVHIHEKTDMDKLTYELSNLRNEFYNFKSATSKNLNNLLREIDSLKTVIQDNKSKRILHEYKMAISELEKEIYIIYNQLKGRPHQPIKIERIWQELYSKHPNYKWETFTNQILKINSKNYHLEEGTVGRYINDTISNKKYGYVIGN